MSRRRNAPLTEVAAIGSNMTQAVHGDLTILYSYRTPVAILAPSGGYVTEKFWSNTTSKHISKFFQLHGYDRKGAAKIPQEDIEAFAIAGRMRGAERLGHAPLEHRSNPELKHGIVPIIFTRQQVGVWIDGAYHHAEEKMADMISEIETPEAGELLEEYEEGLDDESYSEWLDDATEALYAATEDGLSWVWDGGDLILTDEEE